MTENKTNYKIREAESLGQALENLNNSVDQKLVSFLDTFTVVGLWTAALTTLGLGLFTSHSTTALLAAPLAWLAVLFDDLEE